MKFKKLVNTTTDKVLEVLPSVWGLLIVCGITGWLIAVVIGAIKLILKLLGVM